jgi:hypothetical protein
VYDADVLEYDGISNENIIESSFTLSIDKLDNLLKILLASAAFVELLFKSVLDGSGVVVVVVVGAVVVGAVVVGAVLLKLFTRLSLILLNKLVISGEFIDEVFMFGVCGIFSPPVPAAVPISITEMRHKGQVECVSSHAIIRNGIKQCLHLFNLKTTELLVNGDIEIGHSVFNISFWGIEL